MAPTKRDPCRELGDPDKCGSYWTKLSRGNTCLNELDEIPLPTLKHPQKTHPISYLGDGVNRQLCEISDCKYAYGLNPKYVTGPDDGDQNSPHLPELTFEQPVI